MSTSKKRLIINKVTVNLGCSSCRRPKLSSFFNPKPRLNNKKPTISSYQKQPKPKPKPEPKPNYSSSGCSWDTNTTTFSPEPPYYSSAEDASDSDIKSLRAVQGFGKIGGESVAVEKDSDDPYLDFRQSMLQMILEKQIYSKDDLKELLNCFLQLNSPDYHGIIVRAFTEIWNGVFSVRPSTNYTSSPNLHGMWKSRDY